MLDLDNERLYYLELFKSFMNLFTFVQICFVLLITYISYIYSSLYIFRFSFETGVFILQACLCLFL